MNTIDINKDIDLILREIEIECYRQISIEQRNGRAIQEDELEPYPCKEDFNTDIMLEDYTLDKLVADSQQVDPQIDMEEAIQNTPKQSSDEKNMPEPTSKVETKEPKVRGGKLRAYFDAIRDWHYDKHEKEYKYQCAKQQTADRIHGFEVVIDYLHYIKKREAQKLKDENKK